MKVATPGKPVTKTDRDLRIHPCDDGLKSALSLARSPSLRESFVSRPSAQRYAELPSLRYGATPTPTATQMLGSGPLRVTHGENSAAVLTKRNHLKHAKRFSNVETAATSAVNGCENFTSGETNRSSVNGHQAAAPIVRRVRFAELPPKFNGAEREQWEGETEKWMRGKVGIPCDAAAPSTTSTPRANRFALKSSASFPSTAKLDAPCNGTVFTNPSVRKESRGHDTKYRRGTLSQSATGTAYLPRAARDGEEHELVELLRKAAATGIPPEELNAVDVSGRTALSYIASSGNLVNLEAILQLPGININKEDNEGNTPLHFAAQAGQVEVVNYMLSRCSGLEVDARNALGFTPLMKAALQGRTKCSKLLLFAGASPTLRDYGRGLRAEQWARFCGRYVCAEVIEKFARHRLLDRNTAYGRWGSEPELAARILSGKCPPVVSSTGTSSISLKSKLRRAFRTTSNPGTDISPSTGSKSFSVVTQLTTAALCASSPVLPAHHSVTPCVKSLIRPLSVPKLQVTLATSPSSYADTSTGSSSMGTEVCPSGDQSFKNRPPTTRPTGRTKKSK